MGHPLPLGSAAGAARTPAAGRPRHRRALRRLRAQVPSASATASPWTTLNEPWCTAFLGYATAMHAPGSPATRRPPASRRTTCCWPTAWPRRRCGPAARTEVSLALNLSRVRPATPRPRRRRGPRIDGLQNRIFLDPLLRGTFPEDCWPTRGRSATSRTSSRRPGADRRPDRRARHQLLLHVAVAGDGVPDEPADRWVGSPHVRFVEQPLPTTDMGWFERAAGPARDAAPRARARARPAAGDHRVRGRLPAGARRRRPPRVPRRAPPRGPRRSPRASTCAAHGVVPARQLRVGVGLRQALRRRRRRLRDAGRTPRASARWYADVARANALPAGPAL